MRNNNLISQVCDGVYNIRLEYDTDVDYPRDQSESLFELWMNHRDYSRMGEMMDDYMWRKYRVWQYRMSKNKPVTHFVFPMWAYIHSGISVSTSRGYPYNDMFDSGLLAVGVVSVEEAKKNWSNAKTQKELEDRAFDYWQAEVKALNQWFTGQVYYIRIDKLGEELDSCGWVYADSIDEVKSYMKEYWSHWGERVIDLIDEVEDGVIQDEEYDPCEELAEMVC